MLNIIFPKRSPLVNGFEFDAVLEDTFEASVELTRYPIESGVQVNDHRIVNPMKYYITGAIGSKPLRPLISPNVSVDDLLGTAIGAASNIFRDNPYVALVAGLSAGFLAGSDQSRGSATLEMFLRLMQQGLPFFVDAVDIQLKNMVITNMSRVRDPSTEEGLILVMEIQELITLDRITQSGGVSPNASQLIDGDPSQTAAVRAINRGQQMTSEAVSAATAYAVEQAVVEVENLL